MTERSLIWSIAIHQLIVWGTIYLAFPVFIAPMEAELGWTRAEISGAFTAGLFVSGLAAIPAGRWMDRAGSRVPMTVGTAIGAALLVAWAMTDSLAAFYGIWIAIGVTHALCLSEPAYAALTANTRDPRRAITQVTFVTGFTTSVFVPLGAWMVGWMGWRETLVVFAAMQLVMAALPAVWLKGARGSLTGSTLAAGEPLRQAMRRRAFWALMLAFCCQAFMGTGISFHILPLLQESGMSLNAALAVIAIFGPCQVASRAVLVWLGPRAGDIRQVGIFAFAMLPVALTLLAVGPPSLPLALLYGVAFGIGNGLITIVRAVGLAEILGREGYAQISSAITMAAILPRTAAPLALGLIHDAAGSYHAVPWILAGVILLGGLAFLVAILDRVPSGGRPARRDG
ncbi:MFS transporter [Falsiroseomonas sp. HW251]|uniref:MFS transporter n=1 Tax=Falsiroseomonas sp. HW251 TaxID=3390998 RepID=UPI003D3112B8